MAIEDVEYLRKNSVKQSYMFLVDSADRTRSAHPTPSEYIVEFTTPFQKVVGLEVVDASIPRTMYTIDTINNTLCFYIHSTSVDPVGLENAAFKQVLIPVGDYTIQTLVPVLNELLFMNVDADEQKPIAYISSETTTNPPDVQNTLRFRCPYPFFLAMNQSTIAESLGFDTFTQASEANVSEIERRYNAPFQTAITGLPVLQANASLLTKMYHSVDINPSSQLGAKRTVFEGPRGVLRKLNLGTPQTRVAQRFTVTMDGYLTQIFVALTTASPSDTITTEPVYWEVYPTLSTLNHPDISATPIATGTVAISFIDGTLSDSSISSAFLEGGNDYWLVLHVNNTDNGIGVFYNDVLVQESTLYTSSDEGTTWNVGPDNQGIYFQMSAQIVIQDRYHVLTAPGIYSLIGPRYIILRCPEIEENSFRSLAYSRHHLGLAKFRLGVVGYSENRMDFSKVPLREFHPIGKLTKMTLRFELSSGELYNFRGVNHTITFAVHYYEPMQKDEPTKAYMNPNYNADFLKYMYHQEEQEEDSDDQEEDFSRDQITDYRQRELMYLPENLRRRDLQTLLDGSDVVGGPFQDLDLDDYDEEDES